MTDGIKTENNKQIVMEKSCEGCTSCCEGWLWGSAHGHNFFRGRPCQYVSMGKGCSIYKDRPDSPCKSYTCEWLNNQDFPMWMKPSESKVIISEVKWGIENKFRAIEVLECGQKIDSKVLSWLFYYHQATGTNMSVQIDGGIIHYGSREFLAFKGVPVLNDYIKQQENVDSSSEEVSQVDVEVV